MIGLIICHKSLAFELVETAKAIIGYHDGLYPFSNHNLTTEELVTRLNDLKVSQGNPQNAVIMVDLHGGNCWRIAKLFAHENPGYYVLSGVNLPMLLSFLTKKNKIPPEKLCEVIETDAHRGVVLYS
jgi:mannose/fructose-specific phosphotransferase system component IIA